MSMQAENQDAPANSSCQNNPITCMVKSMGFHISMMIAVMLCSTKPAQGQTPFKVWNLRLQLQLQLAAVDADVNENFNCMPLFTRT